MGPQEFVITPENWLPRGESEVRGEQKNLVIWAGIPGEPAVVVRFHEGERHDQARFLRPAAQPHKWRRDPPCERFNVCGGCALMHLQPEGQQAMRLAMVRRALAEHRLDVRAPTEVVSGPDGQENFQHTLKLAVGLSDLGHLRVGVFGRGSRQVVTIPECRVVTPALRTAMQTVAFHVLDMKLYPFEPTLDRGLLRNILLRQSRLTGEILVTVISAQRNALLWELAERLAAGLASVTGVHLHINDGVGSELFLRDGQGVPDTVRLRGKDTIEESVAGHRIRVGPGDIFSTNPASSDLVVRDIAKAFSEDTERSAVDLHCGVGATTLALAAQHGWAFGLETAPSLAERARENALANHQSAEFASGDLAERLGELGRRLQDAAPVVSVDCGRTALAAPVARGMLALKPARLVLRSSNPRTLAHDLAALSSRGWKIDGLSAYETFPQTPHLELLARLSPALPPPPPRRPPRRKVVRAASP